MRHGEFHFTPISLALLAKIRMLANDESGGEGEKKWEPSEPAGGRGCGWHGHPGETSGAVSEIRAQILQCPIVPFREMETLTDSSTRCFARTCGLGSWWGSSGSRAGPELTVGQRWEPAWGKKETANSVGCDSLNLLCQVQTTASEREAKKKSSIPTS